MSLAASKRASELEKDMNAWEENRLLTSGVARLREVGGLNLLLGLSKGWSIRVMAGGRGDAQCVEVWVGETGRRVVTSVRITCPRAQVSLDFDADDDARVLLLVHDTKPPFLEGKVGGGL